MVRNRPETAILSREKGMVQKRGDNVGWSRRREGHGDRCRVCSECVDPSCRERAMPFRLEHITVPERVKLGCTCLLFSGQYGLVTTLAREYGTSRQFFYDLRERTRRALEPALSPGRPGRPALDRRLVVDERAAERAVLVLHQVAHASVRGIQACL